MRIVLTGTAHAGKTSLLGALAAAGYQTLPEAETSVMGDLVRELGSPDAARDWSRANYAAQKARVAEKQRELYAAAPPGGLRFEDRSAVCYLAYCRLRGVEPPQQLRALADTMPPTSALLLAPLPVFDERRSTGRWMTRDEAQALAGLMEHEYASRGIPLFPIPELAAGRAENLSRRVAYVEKLLRR